MGVRGLWRLLDTFGEVTQPADWRGKRVAIDASIWIAQFRSSCDPGDNVEERILEGFFMRILKLLFYGIEPVFVFDGPASMSKRAEQRRRAEHRAALEQVMVTRRARRLIAAQMSAGLLDLSSLPRRHRSPGNNEEVPDSVGRTLPATQSVMDAEEVAEGCPVMSAFAGCCPQTRKRSRRDCYLAPEAVSRLLTDSFLSEAGLLEGERKKHERFHEFNRLAYSSTSIFMGPRCVLEDVSGAPRSAAEKCDGLEPTSHSVVSSTTSSVVVEGVGNTVINVEDEAANDVYQVVDSSVSSGDCSVVVVDGAVDGDYCATKRLSEDTHLCKEEGFTSDEVEVLSVADDLAALYSDGDDLLSLVSDSEASCELSSGSSGCWCPGTQLFGGVEAVAKDKALDGSHSGGRDTPCDEYKFDSYHELSLPPRDGSYSEDTGPLGSHAAIRLEQGEAPVAAAQHPTAYSEQTRQREFVPFELLGIVELLNLCGVPYVLSPSEADSQCAFLNEQRIVDAVFTEDSDVIVHGAPVVLRGFFSKSRHVVAYRKSELRACGVDKVVLVALALLLGCDYAEGVSGLSLLESLHVIAAIWSQPGGSVEDEATRVKEMLTNWRSAVKQNRIPWGDEVPLPRFYRNYTKWITLQLSDSFPQNDVVDAYFSPKVNKDTRCFALASPDWVKLRLFASMHGFLGKKYCSERLAAAQRECECRSQPNGGLKDLNQRQITDFFNPVVNRERIIFKKQPAKFSEALSLLRAARGER